MLSRLSSPEKIPGSRSRSIHEDNLGKYALVRESNNEVVLGERFDATLEDIAEYLN